jgi:hypothetical protein
VELVVPRRVALCVHIRQVSIPHKLVWQAACSVLYALLPCRTVAGPGLRCSKGVSIRYGGRAGFPCTSTAASKDACVPTETIEAVMQRRQ